MNCTDSNLVNCPSNLKCSPGPVVQACPVNKGKLYLYLSQHGSNKYFCVFTGHLQINRHHHSLPHSGNPALVGRLYSHCVPGILNVCVRLLLPKG